MKKKINSPKIDLNEAYTKALHWFFAYPDREIGLNELSAAIKSSKTTTKKVVLQLVNEGFIEKTEIGRIWRLKCNKVHPYNISRKVPYHLNLILESGVMEVINEKIPNYQAVVLFGSYRKGDDNETSDIDIGVEVNDSKEVRLAEAGEIDVLGYRRKVVVNVHTFSRKKIDINLFANIVNGIVLDGFLEVRP